jgi:hypothetical protein
VSTPDDSYFVRIDEHTLQPTRWTGGAWSETEQHFSPLGGLLVHEFERFVAARGADDGLQITQLSFDILGVVGLEPMELHVESVRPGRTIELLEATITWRGRPAVRARAWRLATTDTSAVAGGAAPALPHPDGTPPMDMLTTWSGDYIRSLDVRVVAAPEPGRGTVWISSDVQLVANEPSSPLARYVMLVDTANGIAVRESPREWMFPNVDLSLHLHRHPRGRWVGLDTSVIFGASGHGLTSSVLHDVDGAIGRAEQSLTVRALPLP